MNRDDLYRAWKSEKTEKTLQRLPSSFYSEVRRLLDDSKAASAARGRDQTLTAISEKEFKILRRLTAELAQTRMKKIVDAAVSQENVASDMLTPEEAEFAKQVAVHMGDHYRFIEELGQGSLISEEKAPSKPAEARLEVVRFLSDFPAIIGVDLKTYGPFKAEDIATLPAENASALMNQGVVRQVRVSDGRTSAI